MLTIATERVVDLAVDLLDSSSTLCSSFAQLSAVEELRAVTAQCKPVMKTYTSCLEENNKWRRIDRCVTQETRLVECIAGRLCPEAAKEFQKCEFWNRFTLSNADPASTCAKEAQAMRDSLRKLNLYPIKTPTN